MKCDGENSVSPIPFFLPQSPTSVFPHRPWWAFTGKKFHLEENDRLRIESLVVSQIPYEKFRLSGASFVPLAYFLLLKIQRQRHPSPMRLPSVLCFCSTSFLLLPHSDSRTVYKTNVREWKGMSRPSLEGRIRREDNDTVAHWAILSMSVSFGWVTNDPET